jgi:hypothetical protein
MTGRESEPWEIIYFKLYKTQIRVVEQAIETAAVIAEHRQVSGLLPGDDLCRLSGESKLDKEDTTTLLQSMSRFFKTARRATAGFSARSDREGS